MCRPVPPSAAPERHKVDLADIFRTHGSVYRQTHPLDVAQRRAMRAIECCRTAALGGHKRGCGVCGPVLFTYNSSPNRHAPQRRPLANRLWLGAPKAELLPVEYFHLVF